MSFEVTGIFFEDLDTRQITEKFRRREFILQITQEANGNNYTNFIKFQLVQNKCDLLNPYKKGDQIMVTFNLKGNKVERDDKTSYITNLDAWKIEKV